MNYSHFQIDQDRRMSEMESKFFYMYVDRYRGSYEGDVIILDITNSPLYAHPDLRSACS